MLTVRFTKRKKNTTANHTITYTINGIIILKNIKGTND